MPPAIRGMRAAFVFLTRVPVGGFPYRPADWRWANAYFPLVGAAVGLCGAAAWLGTSPLGPWPAAICAIVATVALTGAFHEDGLADTADALGGGIEDRARVLEILKDSRLGTYGSTALFLSLALRIALLERLGPTHASALVLVHALARTPSVVVKTFLPYVTRDEHARSRNLEGGGAAQVVVAIVTSLAVSLACGASLVEVALLFAAVAAASALLAWRFWRRVRGFTGDFLGAIEQVSEITALLVLVGART